MSDFVSRHKPEWEELERLVARARRQFSRMTPEELSRLDVLYRRTTVHLAQVSTRTRDASLVRYLNDLTAAAHSIIYLPPRRSSLRQVRTFLVEGFPRAVARTWRFHVASLLIVLGGVLIGYIAVERDPAAAYALMPAEEFRQVGSTREQLEDVLRSGRDEGGGTKFAFSSFLFSHNLKVGLLALATGVLAGIPCVFLLFYNGMLLGAFTAVHHGTGIHAEYWAWILPHGITEIGAIVLCGGIGLQLGWAVVCPGMRTREESLARAGREAACVAFGVAVMLLAAALIEGYLRQSYLSTEGRLLFAGVTAAVWAGYFAFGFIRERRGKLLINRR